MAEASYIKSLIGGLGADAKKALDQAFTYLLANLKFGTVAHQTRATNFQAYWIVGVTSSNANEEFSVAHGLGYAPNVVFPVVALDQVGSQLVPLTVSRAADANRVYLKSSSTGVTVSLLVE